MSVIANIKTFFRYPVRKGTKRKADVAISAWDDVVDELEKDLEVFKNGRCKKKPKINQRL